MFGKNFIKSLKIYSKNDFPKSLPKLSNLYDDLFSSGKGYRAQIVKVISDELSLNKEVTQLLCQCVEFIHNSSLLHDDLIDNSTQRRGKTTAWQKYGMDYAVLGGDYLLARVMVNLSSYGNVELLKYTSETISALVEGEWHQDDARNKEDLTFNEINLIHGKKTAALFSWSFAAPFMCLGGSQFSESTLEQLKTIGFNIGILLQRSDDLLDFNIRNYENKALFTDIKHKLHNSFSLTLKKVHDEPITFFNYTDLDTFINDIGLSQINKALESFDKESLSIIKETENLVDQIPDKLFSQKFKLDIKARISKVYWRK